MTMKSFFGLSLLIVMIGGCAEKTEPDVKPSAKPITEETLNKMPPEARASATAADERARAMKEQMARQYGGQR
jgi:PBP1b-binding outer membrane lipoprotein LpoB